MYATASEGRKPHPILLGQELKMTAPANWIFQTPRVRMIEYEFAIPAVEPDKQQGRMTVMTAGGTVEANVERWLGQFTQPDGGATRPKAKTEKAEIAGREVTLVDVSGTYRDSRGPMSPVVDRPGYRMLAAVIPTSRGNYFVKFYGPQKTVEKNAQTFREMIQGIAAR